MKTKCKVRELVGAPLDAAVAQAAGLEWRIEPRDVTWCDGITFIDESPVCIANGMNRFRPSTVWADAGPLIDREQISIVYAGEWEGPPWNAWGWTPTAGDLDGPGHGSGATALIAAMRAYVFCKLGEEVEL
jgi:uncharacterized protein DUF2591